MSASVSVGVSVSVVVSVLSGVSLRCGCPSRLLFLWMLSNL